MKVETIRATPEPEWLVAEAARNDYRSEGVANKSRNEIMEEASLDEDILDEVLDEGGWDDDLRDTTKESPGVVLEAKKRSLLKHLIDGGHWGPFEHPQITLELHGVSRVLMGHITRHRHFTFDIMSLRYVSIEEGDELDEHFQVPKVDEEMVDRKGVHEVEGDVESQFYKSYEQSSHDYQRLLDQGVPPEEARRVLPMGTKVNIVVSANARAWMHILNVRTKANVQTETKECAEAIFEELKEWMPWTMNYYDEHVLPLQLNP